MITLVDRLLIADQLPSADEVKNATRRFYLERRVDVSGVSGTGVVAVGVEFPSGFCVLEWQTETATTEFAPNIDNIVTVHGHDGKTQVIFIDDPNFERDMDFETKGAFKPLEPAEKYSPENSDIPVPVENYHAPTINRENPMDLVPSPNTITPNDLGVTPTLPNEDDPKSLEEVLAVFNNSVESLLQFISGNKESFNKYKANANANAANTANTTSSPVITPTTAKPSKPDTSTPANTANPNPAFIPNPDPNNENIKPKTREEEEEEEGKVLKPVF